jgi:glutathione synthase/RimK-type ligase-like ATP-grasp enzyme
MTELIHIGTTALVSLPDSDIYDVPAKVDTGADSSAIWASNIVEQDKTLSFVLFDTPSIYYTGQPIVTNEYKVTRIKNSFGQTERRYKVYLKIVVTGRTIRATFTLANRKNSRYPILIGRKTLHGKFLVDVSKRSTKPLFDVLMLSTNRTKVTERFAKNVERFGKKLCVTYAAYEGLRYDVGGLADRITLIDGNRDIASFDLVHFKTTFLDITAATAHYLQKRNVPYLDGAMRHFPGVSKLYQYSILADNGIAVPDSIFMFPRQLEGSYDYVKQQLGVPFILKDIHGSRGNHNYLITSKKSFHEAFKLANAEDVQCIAQVYIANDCDYRVLVFGGKIALVLQRMRRDDATHLNNTSQGGAAKLVPVTALPLHVKKLCESAAKLLDRQVAGVDIVQDKNSGLWYCLEVNERPQIATGSFTDEKHAAFAAYLERKLTK